MIICRNCHYWKHIPNHAFGPVGSCHRYPGDTQTHAAWWCGEYKPDAVARESGEEAAVRGSTKAAFAEWLRNPPDYAKAAAEGWALCPAAEGWALCEPLRILGPPSEAGTYRTSKLAPKEPS